MWGIFRVQIDGRLLAGCVGVLYLDWRSREWSNNYLKKLELDFIYIFFNCNKNYGSCSFKFYFQKSQITFSTLPNMDSGLKSQMFLHTRLWLLPNLNLIRLWFICSYVCKFLDWAIYNSNLSYQRRLIWKDSFIF